MSRSKTNTGAAGKSRRQFLKSSGRFVAASALTSLIGRRSYAAGNSTIKLALVGCGGRGTGAVVDALSAKGGPVKLCAMADLFEPRRATRPHRGLSLYIPASILRATGRANGPCSCGWPQAFVRSGQVGQDSSCRQRSPPALPQSVRFAGHDVYTAFARLLSKPPARSGDVRLSRYSLTPGRAVLQCREFNRLFSLTRFGGSTSRRPQHFLCYGLASKV